MASLKSTVIHDCKRTRWHFGQTKIDHATLAEVETRPMAGFIFQEEARGVGPDHTLEALIKHRQLEAQGFVYHDNGLASEDASALAGTMTADIRVIGLVTTLNVAMPFAFF